MLGSGLAGSALAGCSTAEPARTRDAPAGRFPGDPGPGRAYVGATAPLGVALERTPAFTAARLSMSRRFYRPHQLDVLAADVARDLEAGVLPFVSCKVPGSWARVVQRPGRAWLDRLLDLLDAAGAPVWLAVHHEPENDVSARHQPEDWRAMQRHVIARARRRAPSVTVVPVLMQWTFSPASGRRPEDWLIPEADVLGVDVYNQWRPDGRAPWEEFAALVGRVRTLVPDLPLVAPEIGCRADPADPLRAGNWIRTAFEFCLLNDVVAMAYFDAEFDGDASYRLDAERTAALAAVADRPEVARLPEATGPAR